MADFSKWVTAAEAALWKPGTFWTAYAGNRDEAVESVIDGDIRHESADCRRDEDTWALAEEVVQQFLLRPSLAFAYRVCRHGHRTAYAALPAVAASRLSPHHGDRAMPGAITPWLPSRSPWSA
jgi:hypothetical protein